MISRLLSVSTIAVIILVLASGPIQADRLRVAVASNFSNAAKALATRFEDLSGHEVILVKGSSGKHYAQIRNGAPFDLFFSADTLRSSRLIDDGLAMPGSGLTYAVGRLVLWSPDPGLVDDQGAALETGDFRHLAIANPKLAPYGKAAMETLKARQLWNTIRSNLVQGENIGQTFQFVSTGHAELGFVAWSQIKQPGKPIKGSFWLVPRGLHQPIAQYAVRLTEKAAAREFMNFVKSPQGHALIESYGYETLDAIP